MSKKNCVKYLNSAKKFHLLVGPFKNISLADRSQNPLTSGYRAQLSLHTVRFRMVLILPENTLTFISLRTRVRLSHGSFFSFKGLLGWPHIRWTDGGFAVRVRILFK